MLCWWSGGFTLELEAEKLGKALGTSVQERAVRRLQDVS